MSGEMQQNPDAVSEKPVPYFRLLDAIFLVIVVCVVVVVVHLGYTTYKEASQTEATKRNAEAIQKWLEETGQARAEGKPVAIEACAKAAGKTWAACLEALTAPGGPFADLKNVAEEDGLVFAKKCDREQLNTHGAILFEKGTPKIMDPSSYTFGGFEDGDSIEKDVQMKVLVCGRGFSVIKIAELKF